MFCIRHVDAVGAARRCRRAVPVADCAAPRSARTSGLAAQADEVVISRHKAAQRIFGQTDMAISGQDSAPRAGLRQSDARGRGEVTAWRLPAWLQSFSTFFSALCSALCSTFFTSFFSAFQSFHFGLHFRLGFSLGGRAAAAAAGASAAAGLASGLAASAAKPRPADTANTPAIRIGSGSWRSWRLSFYLSSVQGLGYIPRVWVSLRCLAADE